MKDLWTHITKQTGIDQYTVKQIASCLIYDNENLFNLARRCKVDVAMIADIRSHIDTWIMSVDDATPSAFDIGIDPPIQRNHMKCCIDLDGVVADFMSHVANWHSKPNLQEWDMYKKWSMNVEEFWRPLDYDFWFTIPVTDEANELLKIVESHFEDICFLTSPCLTKGCLQGKYDWVKKHFPKYERKLLIGACKEFCASSETVLIDDFDYNIKKFTEAGGLGITFPRPWNINRGLEPLTYIKERCYEISH